MLVFLYPKGGSRLKRKIATISLSLLLTFVIWNAYLNQELSWLKGAWTNGQGEESLEFRQEGSLWSIHSQDESQNTLALVDPGQSTEEKFDLVDQSGQRLKIEKVSDSLIYVKREIPGSHSGKQVFYKN